MRAGQAAPPGGICGTESRALKSGTLRRCRRFIVATTLHVERDTYRAKFWLDPVRLARSGGFGAAELQRIERLVSERQQLLLRGWDEYFSVDN
jgi:hypothetical protein